MDKLTAYDLTKKLIVTMGEYDNISNKKSKKALQLEKKIDTLELELKKVLVPTYLSELF